MSLEFQIVQSNCYSNLNFTFWAWSTYDYVPRSVHVYGHVMSGISVEHVEAEHGGLNFCFTFGVELYEPLWLI